MTLIVPPMQAGAAAPALEVPVPVLWHRIEHPLKHSQTGLQSPAELTQG